MSKVNFTAMVHGTREDYDLVFAHDVENGSHQAERVIGWMRSMDGDSPYHVTRLEHSLQTATRAERDGADEETVVCALLHDIGDVLGPTQPLRNSPRPCCAPTSAKRTTGSSCTTACSRAITGWSTTTGTKNARDRFKDHPYYQDCIDFCANWDQCSFDPDYPTLPLERFIPMIERLFARKPQTFT